MVLRGVGGSIIGCPECRVVVGENGYCYFLPALSAHSWAMASPEQPLTRRRYGAIWCAMLAPHMQSHGAMGPIKKSGFTFESLLRVSGGEYGCSVFYRNATILCPGARGPPAPTPTNLCAPPTTNPHYITPLTHILRSLSAPLAVPVPGSRLELKLKPPSFLIPHSARLPRCVLRPPSLCRYNNTHPIPT